MYTLYYSPATASLAVHWMLIELGVAHELKLVDFETKQQKSADYLKLNPSGLVPTLIVDGIPRTECAALLMLLAERHAERKLAPPSGSAERAEYLQWMLYLADTVQPAFRAWFYPHEPAGEANIEAAKTQARLRLDSVWERIDSQLKNRSHIVGNTLTVADFLAAMLMRWSRNMPKPATEWPHIKAYVQQMRALPSFVKVCDREKLTDWRN
ncbi:MAG TPA: glutathione S-transferase family protein [Steroidobacteraceae bacterium]|nr:glutathione S-transferase family protein [Steroidobacteraceae bacterium]